LVKGKANQTVGVVGFGGLGHMAIKIAKAMGANVVAFSRSNAKLKQAEALGVKLIVSSDTNAVAEAARSIDTILDTVSAEHDIMELIRTLKVDGVYVLLGGVPKPYQVPALPLIFSRYSIQGSLIGGVAETAEMLEF